MEWKICLLDEFEATHAFHLLHFLLASILPEKKKKDNSVVRTSELAEAQVQLSLSQNVKILGTSLSKSAE